MDRKVKVGTDSRVVCSHLNNHEYKLRLNIEIEEKIVLIYFLGSRDIR